jgi:hypothetical protein
MPPERRISPILGCGPRAASPDAPPAADQDLRCLKQCPLGQDGVVAGLDKDKLLNPKDGNVTIKTLHKAAAVVGKRFEFRLV